MTDYRFIEPLDVLYLRGNTLFGDAGGHGAALMPPWPSLAAGALRAQCLVAHGIDPSAYAHGAPLPDDLHRCLGTPELPGTFRLRAFTLARRCAAGGIEPLFPLPADVVVVNRQPHVLRPMPAHSALRSSYPLSHLPTLPAEAGKPESGNWLTAAGMSAYLRGVALDRDRHLVPSAKLWQTDSRLGIALNPTRRSAEEGRIYTTETVALCRDVGFIAGVDGMDGLLPEAGLLRFGGDGRGARMETCTPDWPQPDWSVLATGTGFRLLLTTPGLFPGGWELPGLTADRQWPVGSKIAVLQAAAVSRPQVISGWDLAYWQPKPAQRLVPSGSVYWLEQREGLTITVLQTLVESGLPVAEPTRRAEGFNNILIAAWPQLNR